MTKAVGGRGPECVVRYPNGDEAQYVITAFGAVVVGGAIRPDGDETTAVRYWPAAEAVRLPLAPWLRALLPMVYDGPGRRGVHAVNVGAARLVVGRAVRMPLDRHDVS